MIAYKLVRKHKDGTLGSLFINRKRVLPVGVWLGAEDHKTKGYAHRPGWHCTDRPVAPHLSKKGRIWVMVVIEFYEELKRPRCQGNKWFIAEMMKIVCPI